MMIKEKIDNFGEFEFHAGYFIGRIYEGVNAGHEFVDALSALIQKHYGDQPVIYISDRVNSYSLDPVATAELIARNDIRFSGVVLYTQQQRQSHSYEEKVIHGTTMCAFGSLGAAVSWAELKSQELSAVPHSSISRLS